MVSINSVTSTVYYGPVFKIVNSDTNLTINCRAIETQDVESILIEDCASFNLTADLSITCDGDVTAGMNCNGSNVNISTSLLQGTAEQFIFSNW